MNPIVRDIARALVALAVCLIVISTLAGLSGCSAAPEQAAAPAPQKVDCRHWKDCA